MARSPARSRSSGLLFAGGAEGGASGRLLGRESPRDEGGDERLARRGREPPEDEAGEDRRREEARPGRRQDEAGAGRGFLEDLQERAEGRRLGPVDVEEDEDAPRGLVREPEGVRGEGPHERRRDRRFLRVRRLVERGRVRAPARLGGRDEEVGMLAPRDPAAVVAGRGPVAAPAEEPGRDVERLGLEAPGAAPGQEQDGNVGHRAFRKASKSAARSAASASGRFVPSRTRKRPGSRRARARYAARTRRWNASASRSIRSFPLREAVTRARPVSGGSRRGRSGRARARRSARGGGRRAPRRSGAPLPGRRARRPCSGRRGRPSRRRARARSTPSGAASGRRTSGGARPAGRAPRRGGGAGGAGRPSACRRAGGSRGAGRPRRRRRLARSLSWVVLPEPSIPSKVTKGPLCLRIAHEARFSHAGRRSAEPAASASVYSCVFRRCRRTRETGRDPRAARSPPEGHRPFRRSRCAHRADVGRRHVPAEGVGRRRPRPLRRAAGSTCGPSCPGGRRRRPGSGPATPSSASGGGC